MMMDWLRKRILRWLDLEAVGSRVALAEMSARCAKEHAVSMEKMLNRHMDAAVDLNLKSGANTMIVVASRLDGGRVEVFHVCADNLRDLKYHARATLSALEARAIVDAPKWLQGEWKHGF
jgi:hypothetical protein